MRRAPSHSLLGPALLLYLVADAAAAQGQLDLIGAVTAALAGLLSLWPLRLARSELPGNRRVGWLGLAAACALVRPAVPHALSLVVDLADATALAACSVLVLDLALTVPDRVGRPQRTRLLRVLVYGLGVAVALLGAAAHAPPLQALGRLWLAPSWFARAPFFFLALGLSLSLGLRMLRRRMGSSPPALASNAWAILGLVPAVMAAWAICACALLAIHPVEAVVRSIAVAAACALSWSHLRLVDESRRLSVGPTTRNAVAALLALSISAAAGAIAAPFWPAGSLALGAGVVGLLLFAAALYRGLRELARVMLAPGSGSLLLALERAHTELAGASDLQEVAKVVLGAARAASRDVSAEPLLYLFDPALELRIDAAGQPHSAVQAMHPVLLSALRAEPGEIVLRIPLEAQIVRMPALRPLIDALCGLDALCLLPLGERGELEGALLLPRGKRRSNLTLEEMEALHDFGRHATGFLSVLCGEARAWRRATDALAESKQKKLDLDDARAELSRLSAEVRALRAGDAHAGFDEAAGVAYSPAMRALLARVENVAESPLPVLLVAERGVPLLPLARVLHHVGGRGQRPFVVAPCADVPSERGPRALLGGGTSDSPGWLGLAAEGTLLLCDLPALSHDAQRALVGAISERKLRIVASTRRDPDLLVTEGVLLPELRECFRLRLRVPPLRERVQDLPSLLLIALDHSARVLGRPACGLDPDAQARLLDYEWPGNLEELQTVIERAVARCDGPRVTLHDLAALGLLPAPTELRHPLDGTLERVERRVLQRALERTSGNKSEAARLLGLKRTTFLDKLRRHGLDESGKPRSSGAAPN